MTLPERPLGEAIEPASHSVAIDPEHEYRVAGIYSFGRGLIKRPTINGRETSYKSMARLDVGQLVMSKLNAWEGALAIVPEEFAGTHVSPEYPVFGINTDVAEPGYIAHLVKWPKLWERLTPRGSMVRRKRTNPATLMATMVPLPDLNGQRRIAARLDSELDKLQQIDTRYRHRSQIAETLQNSIIVRAAKSAPQLKPIGEVITLARRQVFPKDEEAYREIGIRSFGRGVFHKEPIYGSEIGSKRVFAIEPGDLLVSNVFAWEGAIALAGDSEAGFIGSHRFMTYRINEELADATYLYYYFTSPPGLTIIRKASPGSAGRNRTLGIKNFEAQIIPLPDLEEQRRIGRMLTALPTKTTESHAAQTIETLRQSLLNAAFSGQH